MHIVENVPQNSQLKKKFANICVVHISQIYLFALFSKTEGPRTQRCITSINKLDHCVHFKPKIKSLAPSEASEAEIQNTLSQKRAWPFWYVCHNLKLRHHFFNSAPSNLLTLRFEKCTHNFLGFFTTLLIVLYTILYDFMIKFCVIYIFFVFYSFNW